MRWSLVLCLLASTALASRPRTKRSIGHMKNLITSKLFGIGSKTVTIARPILSNNETYQLFRIPGINDFLLKVSRKNKTHEQTKQNCENKPKPENKDPVIVKPEVAIIGSYLGTTTQKETMLAIEMVRNLVKSGILFEKLDSPTQEFLIPPLYAGHIEDGIQTPPNQVITEELGHIFVPEYPKYVVSPELKLPNRKSKYYYKKEGPDADITYESYDDKDVLVTRVEKNPQNFKISDVSRVDGNSYPPLISQPLRINGPPNHYYDNQGARAGNIGGPIQNQSPPYLINQGMIAGRIPGPGHNSHPTYNVNEGFFSVNFPRKGQNYPLRYNTNQGNLPETSQNLALFYANQGMNSGNLPGEGQNPPLYNANQGASPGPAPYDIPTYSVNSGMMPVWHEGNALPINNVNPNMMAGHSSAFHVNPGTIGSLPGQIPPYLSHGKPNGGGVGHQNIGSYGSGGLIAERPGQINAHPYFRNTQIVTICRQVKGKPCPLDKTDKTTSNYQNEIDLSVTKQNNIIGKKEKVEEVNKFLKNHTANGQIMSQYSYQQINTQSNKKITEVNLGGSAAVETNKDLDNNYLYHPPPVQNINQGMISGTLPTISQKPPLHNMNQVLPNLSHGSSKPNRDSVEQHNMGNHVSGGLIIAGNNPPLLSTSVKIDDFENGNAERLIICREKHVKRCPYEKTNKTTSNKLVDQTKSVANKQSNTRENAKKTEVVNGSLHNGNRQIRTKQNKTHINNKNTEVKLGDSAVIESNKNIHNNNVNIPPKHSSSALSLNDERHNGNNDAFTSPRTNLGKRRRILPSQRLKKVTQKAVKETTKPFKKIEFQVS